MKYLLLFLLSIFSLNSWSSLAIIEDADGYTNLRIAPQGDSKILHQIQENEVFEVAYDPNPINEDWILVRYPIDKFCLNAQSTFFLQGYIHKSRLRPLKSLASYSGSELKFEYTIAPFDSAGLLLQRLEGSFLTKINGRKVWGVDGGIPRTMVKKLQVSISGTLVPIHPIFYQDLFEVNKNRIMVYKKDDNFFVLNQNSDGAGSYEIVWVFDGYELKQRFLWQYG